MGLGSFEFSNSFSDESKSFIVFTDFIFVESNEGILFFMCMMEVFFSSLEAVLLNFKSVMSSIELFMERCNECFTISNLTFVFSDVSSDDFNLGVVVQGLVSIKVVFTFLSVEEGSTELVEGFFKIIVRVVELGSKGDHVFHGSS